VVLRLEGYVELPEHRAEGGFDHAAVHRDLGRLYVAHTANDAIDVIDLDQMRYVDSIDGLTGVAGALVAESWDLVFTSNRGEDSVGIFDARRSGTLAKVPVGRRPNGLAFDPVRRTLLVANVGDSDDPASHTLSIVDTDRAVLSGSIPVPGRTRWAVFDPGTDRFFVNIADPPSIVVVEGADPTKVAPTIPIAAAGPHGLDVDEAGRLYSACDAGRLFILAPPAYHVSADLPLAGSPDVIFLNPVLRRLYVAIGDPGLIEVFDIDRFERVDTVETEQGAHTIALDLDRHRVYAFLPLTHRAAVFADDG
jgi:DNA-binding beta-propeller fold protein YncE